jgi:YD repeat-containing protein
VTDRSRLAVGTGGCAGLTLAILLCSFLIPGASSAQTSDASVRYEYDSLGRLVAVIDKNGEKATYAYDAVGNLLSITRSTTSVVTIAGFAPDNGYATSSFTLTGTGFSATPAENIVTINGRGAAVTSSSVTQITTTVPIGATSGPISVTTPTGSAVSSAVFLVLGGGLLPNQPTLTSFTPGSGPSGTSVQVVGTNFDPDIGDNTVLFNVTPATITNAAPTTLTVSVPSTATSGPITVITPLGQVTSTEHFVVPPPMHTMADVFETNPLVFGQPYPADVPQGKIAVYFVGAAAGDWINIELVYAGTGFAPYTDATVSLLSPSGAIVHTDFAWPTHAAIQIPGPGPIQWTG